MRIFRGKRTCLALARLCSAMWVGAALLFVTTSVAEQIQPTFDDATKSQLALVRFPWYYGTGITLLTISFVATAFSGIVPSWRAIAMLLLIMALLLMAVDYGFVYRPLQALLAEVQRGEPFARLHAWSERLNAAGFFLAVASTVILSACRVAAAPDRAIERDA